MDEFLSGEKNSDEDYYKILRCTETSTETQIVAEFRLLALKYHPDKNPDNAEALQKFKLLKEARDILTDPQKRENYDKWRRSQISISFKKWQNIGNKCQTTMHWAKPKTQTMLQNSTDFSSNSENRESSDFGQDDDIKYVSKCTSWERDVKELYGQFRRYDI